MSESCFIAGATGYTGQAVVARCVAQKLRTIAHVRPDSPNALLWHQRFAAMGAEVDSTPWQAQKMAARLAQLQPSHVFSVLGTTKKQARQQAIADPYHSIDYTLTAMLIDAAAAQKVAPRFIYLSAMGAGNGRGAYLRARWRIERRLLASGCQAVIARPGLIGGDRQTPRLAERIVYPVAYGASTLLRIVGARTWADQLQPLRAGPLAQALVTLALTNGARGVVAASTLVQLACAADDL